MSSLRETRATLQAAWEAAKRIAEKPNPSVDDTPAAGDAPTTVTTDDRGLGWVDWSKGRLRETGKIVLASSFRDGAYRANIPAGVVVVGLPLLSM